MYRGWKQRSNKQIKESVTISGPANSKHIHLLGNYNKVP